MLNPECAEGKHRNCNRHAWDNYEDELTNCACRCHDQENT